MSRRVVPVGIVLLAMAGLGGAQELPLVQGVEAQPLIAQARRVAAALELAGAPLEAERARALETALGAGAPEDVVAGVQRALDPLCLVLVDINPESRVKVTAGPAPRELAQGGWRVFLVKVHNEAGVTAGLRCNSPNAQPPYVPSSGAPEPSARLDQAALRDRWLGLESFEQRPLAPGLSGLALEYRLLLLCARDAGAREARLAFDIGQGTQDLGFRAEADLLFQCAPAVPVTLRVQDADGRPTTASFRIRDGRGHVFPNPAQRLEPDFFFHDQVYRADGEQVLLTPGRYQVSWTRGPEYRVGTRTLVVGTAPLEETFRLERWIDLAALGWYSGDHHVHAAGCAHYEAPGQGVGPEAMMRHVLGEDLDVGCVLSWGPCWYAQKRFFDGRTHPLSTPEHLLRYDVEVSGFPSSHAGHLVLLRLREDDYPGTARIEDWPSWDLPILRWARAQGAVVGFAHSGFGLEVDGTELPTYQMPRFDGIGANEYVVDVTQDAVDFISTVDTPAIWELNAWYHVLNCGYATRISGETDFPCISGERVGVGRSYVRLGPGQALSFDAWSDGIRDGRSYVSDGRSHIVDFAVGGLAVGAPGAGGRASMRAARAGETLAVTARVAALLEQQPQPDIQARPLDEQPYWHLERARIGASRKVAVELVVNGRAVDRREIEADGTLQPVAFELKPGLSSWVALRIFPSSHTNPVFVELEGKPIRASRRSAEWCAEAVQTCWRSKLGRTRASEREAAQAAYEAAAAAYRSRAAEAAAD